MHQFLKYAATIRLRRARSIALAGPMLAVTCGLAMGATPASAVEGVHRVDAPSVTNSSSPKTMTAYCPVNERVVGGGGWVSDTSPSTLKPTLTELRPNHIADVDGILDSYVVTAAETAPQTSLNWSVTAYAMCAKPIPGISIKTASTPLWSSSSVQATAAVCPAGQRVIGSGAKSSNSSGNVVLQVARPSHPGDIARAQAHEGAYGYAGYWNVTAYAICAPPPSGYEVVFDESPLRASELVKVAGSAPNAGCTTGKRLLSSGAAISNVAPGNVSLQRIYPYVAFQQTYATAVENTPTALNWDFIVASSVCAY
jgi:hypothetical protein